MQPSTGRIIETALYAADVNRAAKWYQEIFGFPIIFEQGDRLRTLQVAPDQVLLLFKEGASLAPTVLPGGMIPAHNGSGPMHLAFAMRTAEAEQWVKHLNARGVEIESRVNWGKDDLSLYFRDLDNHVLELISGDYWQKLAAHRAQ
jgi:catechol 2,3-dioxygenase-like lactoylglutathione lyase family enzyme